MSWRVPAGLRVILLFTWLIQPAGRRGPFESNPRACDWLLIARGSRNDLRLDEICCPDGYGREGSCAEQAMRWLGEKRPVRKGDDGGASILLSRGRRCAAAE